MDNQVDPNSAQNNQSGGQPIPPSGDQGGTPPPPPPPPQNDQGITPPPPPPPPAGDQSATPPPQAGQVQAGQQQAAAGQDLSGIMEENVDISGLVANAGNKAQQQQFITSVKIPPHPNTTFDEKVFLELLAGSISLTIDEKKRIIDAISQLSQFQIDELIKIFKEEQQKFNELEKKHADQIADLEKKHADSWQDLESKAEEETKGKEEQGEADDIRKSLGI